MKPTRADTEVIVTVGSLPNDTLVMAVSDPVAESSS